MAGGTEGHDEHEAEERHAAENAPRDLIEAFGRKFYPSEHTHLDQGGADKHAAVQEILPWLKFSAELDPNRVETYTVSAYWLSQRLGKPNEAKAFLREGLLANPGNPAILFELGRIAANNDKDISHAVNLFELAATNWQKQEAPKKEPNTFLLEQIYGQLARIEEERGNFPKAIEYLGEVKKLSPHPDAIEKQIRELFEKKR
jgi:tetratricopeptide (TPR) repeat protein